MKGYFLSATDSSSFKGDEGMIGLGYRGSKKEEQYSFINQLYDNGLIFHRVFTQNFEKGDQGIISFASAAPPTAKSWLARSATSSSNSTTRVATAGKALPLA